MNKRQRKKCEKRRHERLRKMMVTMRQDYLTWAWRLTSPPSHVRQNLSIYACMMQLKREERRRGSPHTYATPTY